jgi:hypothetical protein
MQILYILAVVSFAVLLIAAIAITRHIRRSSSKATAEAPESAPSIELSTAIDQRLASLARPPTERPEPKPASKP